MAAKASAAVPIVQTRAVANAAKQPNVPAPAVYGEAMLRIAKVSSKLVPAPFKIRTRSSAAVEKSDAASNATSVASVDDDVSPSTYQKND